MKYVFSIVVLFLFSCSSDNETENTNAEIQISGYKVTINSQSTDSSFPYVGQTIINGVVQNGKLMEVNEEFLLNGVSQGVSVNSSLTYQGSLLVSHMDHNSVDGSPRVRNYYYDSNSKLIGATRIVSAEELYYRFVYVSNDLIYFEKISLPYNDPNTQILRRYIAVFEGDDIVQAGRDYDLDGIMDNVNHFQYNNGNLVAVNNATQSLSFNHSDVINNMNVLNDNSYGKKNRRIVGIEAFPFDDFQGVLEYSKNLTNDELLEATYEVYPSNYYHLKSNSYVNGPPALNFNATITRTTEFFFN
ncbi:hypothetical protein [Flavobacterium terrigena]|uniref:Uncharacterized protein n=1 Tax=Flavobacterium terrigena TaxID=402734 RepID=A0A1H6RYG0_9FLAO|nr:hypothetical protein [Flavobacterium terrigena]SEI60711.1 hypothetical protein SAMN05660918_1122 [Flavobacterium terrigena]